MKISIALIVCCAVFVSPFMVQAETVEKEEPFRVIWDGKDVPPLCFDKLLPMEGEGPAFVEIKDCEKIDAISIVETRWIQGDYVTDYKYRNDESARRAYASYRPLGKVKNSDLVSVSLNGGGSGVFSYTLLVKVENGKVYKEKEISGGDRCNGGIVSAHSDGINIYIEKNITPADFLDLVSGEYRKLEAYKDLESSAGSCSATVLLKDGEIPEKVTLNVDWPIYQDINWVSRYRYQKCFNDVFHEQLNKKVDLSISEFKEFVDHFYATCVKE